MATLLAALDVTCVPVPQPRQRQRVVTAAGGKAFAMNYTPKADPVNTFKAALQAALPRYCGLYPLSGALSLEVHFWMPRPQKVKGRGRAIFEGAKDLDNLTKAVQDALNGLLWFDDRQIRAFRDCTVDYAAADELPGVTVLVWRRDGASTFERHSVRPLAGVSV